MASALDSLLTPEGAVLTDPTQVRDALTTLWRPPDDRTAARVATRVCVGNLVAVAPAEQWGRLANVLGELSPAHPTRSIVVLLDENGAGATAPAEVRASVSAICHVPQPGRPQVCCEQIVLRAGGAALEDLDRTLLPLLAADLPTTVWWRIDPNSRVPSLATIAGLADQFILDAGPVGMTWLGEHPSQPAREVGWARSHRWRELVSRMFDSASPEAIASIDRVNLSVAVGDPEGAIDAAWVLAFLGGQLDWRLAPEAAADPVAFQSPSGGTIRVSLGRESHGRGLTALTVASGSRTFEVLTPDTPTGVVELRICEQSVCSQPRTLQARPPDVAAALEWALRHRGPDPVYDRARTLAAQIYSILQRKLR